MKNRYRVKLTEDKAKALNKKAKKDKSSTVSVINGYLAAYDVIQDYSRQEAIKKAGWFDGTIEHIKSVIAKNLTSATLQQIGENVLLEGVLKVLNGREAFNDADYPNNTERIYHGDVFEAILGENAEIKDDSVMKITDKAVLDQLEELSIFVDADYLQIVN